MLDTFRRHSQHWIIKILFVLLILSFGVWGIGDVVRLRAESQPAITVGKMEIAAAAVVDDFRRQADRLITMSRGKITVEQARQMGVLDNSIQQIVSRTLLDQEATRLKLSVDEDTLRSAIAADPTFQNERKQFDKLRYSTVLERSGLSEKAFLAEERSAILRSNLLRAVEGGVVAPAAAVEPLFRYAYEQRVAETITFPSNKMPEPAKPDDALLQTFYNGHISEFTAPELRGVTAVVLRPGDLTIIPPSDADVEKAYQARLSEYVQPEKRALQLVTLPDEAKAKAFAAAVKGKDFAAQAAADSADLIDLGTIEKKVVPNTEIADAAFALPAAGVAGPVQSPLGWHVVRVAAITPGKNRSLAEVKASLVQELTHADTITRLYPMSVDLEDKVGSGASLEEAATALNVKPVKIDAIDAQGNGPNGKPLAGLTLPPAALAKLFQTGQGTTSEVEKLDDDSGYFALRVDQVTAPAPRPFALIKDQVAAAWALEEKERAARKLAEAAAERLGKGEALAAVAGSFKAETTAPFRRIVGPDSTIPGTLPPAVFKLTPGGAVVVDAPDGSAVAARLKSILPADPQAVPAVFENARAQFAKSLGGDILSTYRVALQKDIGVSVNRPLIDQQFEK